MRYIQEPVFGMQFDCSKRIIDCDSVNEIALTQDKKQLSSSYDLLGIYNKEHDWFETNVELTAEEKHELAIEMIKVWAEFGNVKVDL